MRGRIAVSLVLAITLTACASGPKRSTSMSAAGWYKAGVSEEQRAEDIRYCQRTADREASRALQYREEEAIPNHNDDGRAFRRQSNTFQAKRYRRDLFDACLMRYGYTRGVPEPAAPSQAQ